MYLLQVPLGQNPFVSIYAGTIFVIKSDIFVETVLQTVSRQVLSALPACVTLCNFVIPNTHVCCLYTTKYRVVQIYTAMRIVFQYNTAIT